MSNIYHLEPPTKGKVVLHTTYGDVDVELWAREVRTMGPRAVVMCGVRCWTDVRRVRVCVSVPAAVCASIHAPTPHNHHHYHNKTPKRKRQTPVTCRNFVQLALEGYYDGTLFHRIVPNFMVQGGDPTGTYVPMYTCCCDAGRCVFFFGGGCLYAWVVAWVVAGVCSCVYVCAACGRRAIGLNHTRGFFEPPNPI